MKKIKIFILVSAISFSLVLIVKAFENPTQNPPSGGGALQIQSNQLLITKPTKVTGTNTFIVEGGNVGIGTTNPAHKLDVALGGTNVKTYDYGLETTVNTTGGWARAIRFRNEYNNATVSFGALHGAAYISTGVNIGTDPTGYQSIDLYVSTNGNVGIGTTAPAQKLHVVGNAAITGNVGIGTTNPSDELTIETSGVNNPGIALKQNSAGVAGDILFYESGTLSSLLRFGAGGSLNFEDRSPSAVSRFFIDTNGNIGIGTTAPGTKLDVVGTNAVIRSRSGSSGKGGAILQGILDVDNGYSRAVFAHNAWWDETTNLWNVDPVGANDAQAILIPNNGGFHFIIHPSTGNTSRTFSHADFIAGTKMTINTNGNVGIGTTVPDKKLDVRGGIFVSSESESVGGTTLNTILKVPGTTGFPSSRITVYKSIHGGGNVLYIGNNYYGASNGARLREDTTKPGGLLMIGRDGSFNFYRVDSAGVEFADLVISGGNVGIGTTAPSQRLDVAGNVIADDYLTHSDIRFKQNILPLNSSGSVLEKLNNLRGVYFKWNDIYKNSKRKDNKRHIGLIAQEVEKEFPELVFRGNDGSDYLSVDYSRFTAVLLEGLKELNQKLEEFKDKIENGVFYVKEIFTHRVTTKEIQLIDKSTNEIYCVWLENGEFQKSKGECK